MQDAPDQLEHGEIRVTSTSPIMGETGDFELVATHYSQLHDAISHHRFVWEFTREAGEIEGYSFACESGHSAPLTPAADLVVIGYVEQYLEYNGVAVDRVLSEGMYRPGGEDGRFEDDVGLEVE